MYSTAKIDAKKRQAERGLNAHCCVFGCSWVAMGCMLPSLSQADPVNAETYQLVQTTNDALRAAYQQKFHTPPLNPFEDTTRGQHAIRSRARSGVPRVR